MTYRICILVFVLSGAFVGCAFSKPERTESQNFGQSEYGLTVDWRMEGQEKPDAALKAIRLLSREGEVLRSDASVTLPASVPLELALMAEFPSTLLTQDIDFLRGMVRFGDRVVYLPTQLTAAEPNGNKRRLTFQVAGLNAAFRAEKSGQGNLQIEVFSRSQRLGTLEAGIRTPPSEVKFEEIPIKAWESTQAQGDVSEYLKPIIAGKQLNLLRVIRFNNAENLPVQIQTPRRPKGTFVQWTNRIAYNQAECSYSRSENASNEVLSEDVLIVPLDDRFITEAERLVSAPEVIGDLSTIAQPSADAFFGIYALGKSADHWMNDGPLGAELSTASAVASCGKRCVNRVCEPSPGRGRGDRFQLQVPGIDIYPCYCEQTERTYNRVDIVVGVDRHSAELRIPKEATQTPVRFADLDPHRDGEVRLLPTLTEQSEVSWLR